MNQGKFEESLRRATVRPVPSHWRAAILSAAREAQERSQATVATLEPAVFECGGWFRRLAWGGLATAWLAVFTLNWAANRPGAVEALFSPEVVAVAMRQSQLLAGGLDDPGREVDATEPQRPAVNRPRSARAVQQQAV